MKYKPEEYIESDFYSDRDGKIINHKEKIVKCRKTHLCTSCHRVIKQSENALFETGIVDGEFVTCYTCLTCLDKWLDELKDAEETSFEDDEYY